MPQPFRLLLDDATVRSDDRGSLRVLYESSNAVLKRSFSRKGVFRGMHVQLAPHPQTKLVRVVSGAIVDFVLEIGAPKMPLYWREIQSADEWLEIGPQYAHGFYALEDTVFEYVCDGGYNEGAEKSYSIIEIVKKIVGTDNLILSEKDRCGQELPQDSIILSTPLTGRTHG